VLKALADRPAVLLVDLNKVSVLDPIDLVVLPTLDRRASVDGGLRMQCYAEPGGDTGSLVRRLLGQQMTFHADRESALSAGNTAGAVMPRAYLHLPAQPQSPRLARAAVVEVCRSWGIPWIVGEAQLIVSELVTNAVQHAGTEVDLILTLRDGLLHLQVRDTGFAPALFPIDPAHDALGRSRSSQLGGRGLLLVAALATSCGTTIGALGKTVWASLRVRPEAVHSG
jgi:anti-sigma regulatory factor (Ser/Thr protein kinase)